MPRQSGDIANEHANSLVEDTHPWRSLNSPFLSANGVYLDSNGNFTKKTPQGKPVFSTPGYSLPVKPETLEKVLSGISKALPDGSPEARTKLGRLGVPDDAIKFLSQIQALATSLGKVVPYLGAAIMVAEWLGILKNGPDAITTLVTQRFNDLETLLQTPEYSAEM